MSRKRKRRGGNSMFFGDFMDYLGGGGRKQRSIFDVLGGKPQRRRRGKKSDVQKWLDDGARDGMGVPARRRS